MLWLRIPYSSLAGYPRYIAGDIKLLTIKIVGLVTVLTYVAIALHTIYIEK